jgi:hypothetical protein
LRIAATAALVALITGLIAVPASARKPKADLLKAKPITIMTRPVLLDRDKPDQIKFGKLTWLGTVELSSPEAHFGGYSGLALDQGGTKLYAVSDAGTWLTAKIERQNGRIARLVKAQIGPLLGKNGKPATAKRERDAEALTLSGDGRALIAFEQRHRIEEVPLTAAGFGTPKKELNLPAQARSAKGNTGLEAITWVITGPAKGALLAFTEEYLDKHGNHRGWLIGGPKPGTITLKRRNGFAITDAATLPGGDVVVLERRFRFSEGVRMRLRRIASSDIKPGALLDGDILFATDDTREIDNMEGLAVHRDETGRTILTIISDDNFNSTFQSTLLMQFAVVGE